MRKVKSIKNKLATMAIVATLPITIPVFVVGLSAALLLIAVPVKKHKSALFEFLGHQC